VPSGTLLSWSCYANLALLSAFLSFWPNLFPLPPEANSRTIASPASQISEPGFFELAEGDSLKVSAQGPPGFSFDIFVYDTSTHDLVGRSDDDSTAPFFLWTASRAGRYSIVLRNVSALSGEGLVTVLPRGSKSGAADTRPKTLALVEIPYATDRQLGNVYTKNGKGIQMYGAEPADNDKLNYGVARVSIPRAHRMGELEAYSILKLEFGEDEANHVVLKEVTATTADEFGKIVGAEVNTAPNHDVLVFVHGFNTGFEDGLRRAAQIKYDLNFGGATVLYSWPSHGEVQPVSYNQDGRNAELSIPHFKTFLNQLAAVKGVKTIHVLAHSMGNRVVMHALAEGTDSTRVHLRHIALMAPDIDSAVFRKLATSMKSASDQITLYASSKDKALIASEMFAGYPRAGQGGQRLVVMPGIVDTIDASNVDIGLLGLNHSYFADSSTILCDLYGVLHDNPADKRFGLREESGAAGKYWIFEGRVR